MKPINAKELPVKAQEWIDMYRQKFIDETTDEINKYLISDYSILEEGEPIYIRKGGSNGSKPIYKEIVQAFEDAGYDASFEVEKDAFVMFRIKLK